jgi:H+-transporting ATPase
MKAAKPTILKSNKPVAKPVAPAKPTVAKSPATPAAPASAPAAVPHRKITSDLIAARAYTIWEQQGRPANREVENWLLAERQLKQEI